ncbi:DoxX family protein [Massilia sp. erpn]|uniref:DoxX family protein n=1 Tax=Massilia sp. erpn TaxID=2738142 RepID=UPI002102F45F|nr:DoxX family protein [Massilia sp. erpn]
MKPSPSARTHPTRTPPRWREWAAAPALHWLGLLLLCAAYLQGGLNKLMDFGGAVAEMRHFGLSPAAPLAAAVILGELGAALLVLSGRLRWLGALGLALFTVAATFVANRYWQMQGMERFMAANSFYEHLGLAGAFLLVAWHDLRAPQGGR